MKPARALLVVLALAAHALVVAPPAPAFSQYRAWWHPVAASPTIGVRTAGSGIIDLFRTSDRVARLTLRDPLTGTARWGLDVRGHLITAGRVPDGVLTFGQEAEPSNLVPGLRQTSRLSLLRDGQVAWMRTFEKVSDALGDTGDASLAGVLRDADGDGHSDPVVSVLDRRPAGVTKLTSRVYSGRTGAELAVASVDGIRGTAVNVPAGDVDGDGLSDLFLVGIVNANSAEVLRLNAIRGKDGTVLWSRDITRTPPAPTFDAILPLGDGSGDGKDDLLIVTPGGGTNQLSSVAAYSGAGGITMWSRPFAGAVAKAQPMGNGDTIVASIPPPGSGSIGINVSRLSGATGVHLWDRVYSVPGTIGSTDWRLDWNDADGDGLADVYISNSADQPEPVNREYLVSGATGDPVWSNDHGDQDAPIIQTFRHPVGRSAGQGLWMSAQVEEGDLLTVIDGPTGEPLWSRVDPEWSALWSAGHADADGLGDVLRATSEGLTAFDGRDGTVLWSV